MTSPLQQDVVAATRSDFEAVVELGSQRRGYFSAIIVHANLLFHFAARDLRVRHKQTLLGVAWGLLRPLLSTGAFTIIFGLIAGLPSIGTVAYPLVVFSGILPWQLFATGVLHASVSVTQNAPLVTRIYFPRIILPMSALVNGLVDFLIGLTLLLLALLIAGEALTLRLFALPVFAALALLIAFGFGVWLAALNVRYRDFSYLTPFALQLGLFISPIGFIQATIPESWRFVYSLNPMVGVIDGFRWSLLESAGPLDPVPSLMALGLGLVIATSGIFYFRRAEASFADRI